MSQNDPSEAARIEAHQPPVTQVDPVVSATKLQRRLLLPLSALLMILVCGFSIALYSTHQEQLSETIQKDLNLAVIQLYDSLDEQAELLVALQNTYVNKQSLLRQLKVKDRDKLLELSRPTFDDIRSRYGVTHFYYHDTKGVNILRVHKPEHHGDVIHRHTMNQAIRTGEVSSGIELGKLGMFTLRVVQPVRDESGEVIGYIELGREIKQIIKEVCDTRDLEVVITIHKSQLDRDRWIAGRDMLEQSYEWDRFKDDVVIFASSQELPIRPDILAHKKHSERPHAHSHTDSTSHHHTIEQATRLSLDNGTSWYTMARPLRDASNEVVGDIVVFNNITAAMARFNSVLTVWVAIGSGALVGLIALLYLLLRSVDKSIREREQQLSQSNEVLSEALEREHLIRSDLETAMGKLEIAATTDKLTGLANRKVFHDSLMQAIDKSQKNGHKFAVLFFDFDRFKIINDSLGHKVGDALLQDIANIFRRSLRSTDTIARFGGDEFVVLVEPLNEWDEAERIAKELLEILAAPHQLDEHLVAATASIGMVTNEYAYTDPDAMIRDADIAMYQAKGKGKAQVAVFDRAMHAVAMDRLSMEADLRKALQAGDQFKLMYQPIVDLRERKIAGFEALIRWERPGYGLVSPADFIPISEDTGMIHEIGMWALSTAAEQITEWNDRLGFEYKLKVNVNVSKIQLMEPAFLEEVLKLKRRHKLRSGELHLEITESTIADDRSNVIPLLHKLRGHGFPIAMDDFGTGVSSLSALHEYPIDILKIDQAFIRVLELDRSLLAVVMSITSLAENLGILTVAEGIETESIVGALQSIDCTWGQGYYFARPLTPEDAESYMMDFKKQSSIAA